MAPAGAGSPAPVWIAGRFRIDLSRPKVMGIVNLTPDSFSGVGGHGADPAAARVRCERLLEEGADLLDLGAESTRPGATPVGAEEEWSRLAAVLRGALALGCPVSVDTHKAEVMRRALDAGAHIVNDVHALQGPGALDVVAAHPDCGVCLMHSVGAPGAMPPPPAYRDVVDEVGRFLAARTATLRHRGIAADRIVLDPGIGFSKSPADNLALLRRQAELRKAGRPLLVGWSRKSTLGVLTGRPVDARQAASVAAALAAVERGAAIVRVHDVAATVDALRVWEAAGLGAR